MTLRRHLQELHRDIPQAKEELSSGAPEKKLLEAVRFYSRYRPLEVIRDYAGDGSTYEFALPKEWRPGFSAVKSVEYPIGSQDPDVLDRTKYKIYADRAGYYLRFVDVTPDAGETARVTITTLHRVNAQDDTIPEQDVGAVRALAKAYLAYDLAAKYAGFTDPSLAADVINYRTKRREYESVAGNYEDIFWRHLGIDPRVSASKVEASGSWGQMDYDLLDRKAVAPP